MSAMARKAKGIGKVRADLECAVLALSDMEELVPLITLRIEQAIKKSELSHLLCPAQTDLMRMSLALSEAKVQINSAISKLLEK